jgi:asparagine synthase (glutamine-hydrolysing)
LLRDRFGEKPLHVIEQNGALAAASEINQFVAAGMPFPLTADMDVVCDFLELGQAEAGTRTFFKSVTRLAPGHHGVWDLSGRLPRALLPRRIFPARKAIDPRLASPAVAAEALSEALTLSVGRRMVADVTVGSCLSGGLDSTAIVRLAAMSNQNGQKLECVCAVFDELDPSGNDLSERKFAEAAAAHSGINLHFITPSENDVAQAIAAISARQGEPFAHSSIAAQHFVFKAAREAGIVVMLDGQGADELFGGYTGMLGARLADILTQEGIGAWQRAIVAFAADGADLDEPALKRATLNALLPEKMRRGLGRIRGRWPMPDQLTRRTMAYEPNRIQGLSRMESLVESLTTQRSLPSLLRYEDRNAMSFGIETRLPFLSREVADLAEQMPGCVKAGDGWTKLVLRRATQGLVPDMVANRRRKLGFISPHDRWMAGALKAWAQEGILAATDRFGDSLSLTAVKSVTRNLGRESAANAAGFRLASLGHWAAMNHVSG